MHYEVVEVNKCGIYIHYINLLQADNINEKYILKMTPARITVIKVALL